MSVRDELLSLGFKQLKLDLTMFTLIREGSLIGIICCHVHDFLHAGNETFEAVMCKLRQRFLAGKIEEGNFRYIEFKITQNTDRIKLDHSMYMEKTGSSSYRTTACITKAKTIKCRRAETVSQVSRPIKLGSPGFET